MNNQDPIADMLTRIRNANRVGRRMVLVRNSKICSGIARVLKDEGYIEEFDVIEDAARQGHIRIRLRYASNGEKIIHELARHSKPGRRVYRKVDDLPKVLNGLGTAVISTSKGVVNDREARKLKIGGEVLCYIW